MKILMLWLCVFVLTLQNFINKHIIELENVQGENKAKLNKL